MRSERTDAWYIGGKGGVVSLIVLLACGCDAIPKGVLVGLRTDQGVDQYIAQPDIYVPDAFPLGYSSVTGRILEACTEAPIAGVDVMAYASSSGLMLSAVSGLDGQYLLPRMWSETWWIRPSKGRHLSAYQTAVIRRYDGAEYIDIRLCQTPEPPTSSLPVDLVDLLLVVDSSPAMFAHQDRLVSAFERLVYGLLEGLGRAVLVESTVKYLDLRVGLVSANLGRGSDCQLVQSSPDPNPFIFLNPECQRPESGYLTWKQLSGISSVRFGSEEKGWLPPGGSNPDGNVRSEDIAKCLFKGREQDFSGCYVGQPLEAARRALDYNSGFRRSKAALVIIIITPNDDCSAQGTTLFAPDPSGADPLFKMRCFQRGIKCNSIPSTGKQQNCTAVESSEIQSVDSFAEWFGALRQNNGPAFVGVLAGQRTPVEVSNGTLGSVCDDSSPSVWVGPATRLGSFVDRTRPYATLGSLCGKLDLVLRGLGAQAAQTVLVWPCSAQ